MSKKHQLLYGPLNSDSVVSFFQELYKQHHKIFVLVDENTQEHCWPLLVYQFDALKNAEILLIPAGETQKDIEITIQLWEILTQYNASRNDIIINLGGGVITDLGGFIASTFKRGMHFINIPTTLLGMVDAAIGGKNGINFQGYKNQIGTYNQPDVTIISAEFLATLPEQEVLSGMAEMIKHGLIADQSHYEALVSGQSPNENSQELISASANIKNNIVEKDFKESGLRKLLNYGHTVGHAIESYSHAIDKPIPHGFAIAYGMCIENEIANLLNILDSGTKNQVNKQISSIYPKIAQELLNTETLIDLMKQDKKSKNDSITMALIEKVGQGKIVEAITPEVIAKGIENFKNAT